MNIQKSLDSVMDKLMSQIEKVDLDKTLGVIGLQLARPRRGGTLPVLVGIGIGVVLGSGAALLLAPTNGKELRTWIGTLIGRMRADEPAVSHAASAADAAQIPPIEPRPEETIRPLRPPVPGTNTHTKSLRVPDGPSST